MHTHTNTKIPNTQSRKDPNAKSQMFLLRPPAFGGQSCLRDQMISRLAEFRSKSLKKGNYSEFNSGDDGPIIWKVQSYLVAQNKQIRSDLQRAMINP